MKAFTTPKFALRGLLAALIALISLCGAQAAPGDLDALDLNIVGNYVLATAVQPDGKTILGGSFTQVMGVPRNNIARLNADGTLDLGFNPSANNDVHTVVVQHDGQILLGGGFTSIGGITRNRIARVTANGTLDVSFDPNANSAVYSMAVQANGQILLGGYFTSVGGTMRNFIARVNANGTLDAGFDPNASSTVFSVAIQEDGQILLGGAFTIVAGIARNFIARVAANGMLDASFDPNVGGTVYCVAVQADGQILLGGFITSVGGTPRNNIARVAANGTLDADFNPNAESDVHSMAVQADGQILLGGEFTTVGGTTRNRIARVAANGTLDADFNPNVNSYVYSVALQGDGQILVGGDFTSVGGTARNLFARLVNAPATQTLSVVNTTQVSWMRGGSAPEVSLVTFELSSDSGSSYIPLGGSVTRVGSSANWQLTGLSLPASGQVRARGRTTGGYQNGGFGLVESVISFSGLPVTATYTSATDVPVTAVSYTATGQTVNFTLGYAPTTGTALTVVKNTGLGFISGTFDNLAQGQAVALSFGGVTYNFVANYFGGSGNDLVLVWAGTRAMSWGHNGSGQLGNNTLTSSRVLVPVSTAGVLAGKTVIAVSGGEGHSLALCSDGTLAAWGGAMVSAPWACWEMAAPRKAMYRPL